MFTEWTDGGMKCKSASVIKKSTILGTDPKVRTDPTTSSKDSMTRLKCVSSFPENTDGFIHLWTLNSI